MRCVGCLGICELSDCLIGSHTIDPIVFPSLCCFIAMAACVRVTYQADCVGTFINDQGFVVSRVWANPPYSFDNVLAAFMTLYEVATLEGMDTL